MTFRKLIYLQLAAIWPFMVCSFEIQRQGTLVFIKSNECKEVQSISQSILSWKQKTDAITCKLNLVEQNKQCSIEVSQCLPENIKNYFGKNSSEGGPNCHNAGLVYMRILPNLRYTTSEEISFYMNSDLCKKRGLKEKPSVGDLGLISMAGEGQQHHAQHSFIYLSEEFVYEKPNQNKESPFTIAHKRNTLSEYGLNEHETANDNPSYKGIDRKVTYYHCISTNEYLGENPDVPQLLIRLWDDMDSAEKCLESFTMSIIPLSEMAKENILNIAKALTIYLKTERTQEARHNKEKSQFMIASLQMKLKSISENLPPNRYIKKTDDELVRFSENLSKVLKEK